MSLIFQTDNRAYINKTLTTTLNSAKDYLSEHTLTSTRAAGDAIQSIVAQNFGKILGDLASEYTDGFARRAMADVAFVDRDGKYHVVDVKTHRHDVAFSMPNLISVERLCRYYEDNSNYFDILLINYAVVGTSVTIISCEIMPIEWLSWDCLTIGALGWGQIQIANAKNVTIQEQTRCDWMLTFCDRILTFYPKEIVKVNQRIVYFEKARAYWLAQEDAVMTPQLPEIPVDEGEIG